jgi:hypothetical protein
MALLKSPTTLTSPFLSFYLIHLGPLLPTPPPPLVDSYISTLPLLFYDTLGFFFTCDDHYDLATAAFAPNTRSVISHQYP